MDQESTLPSSGDTAHSNPAKKSRNDWSEEMVAILIRIVEETPLKGKTGSKDWVAISNTWSNTAAVKEALKGTGKELLKQTYQYHRLTAAKSCNRRMTVVPAPVPISALGGASVETMMSDELSSDVQDTDTSVG
jgi:hypothetical protein